MSKAVYIKHLQSLSHTRWNKKLELSIIERIFYHTELHPFYMNVLCQIIWEENDLPSIDKVDALWDKYAKAQKHLIAHDINDISLNQRRLISAVAKKPTSSFQSIDFIAPLKLSASSTQQAADVLLLKDLIYRDQDNLYRILDPAMQYYLNKVLWE